MASAWVKDFHRSLLQVRVKKSPAEPVTLIWAQRRAAAGAGRRTDGRGARRPPRSAPTAPDRAERPSRCLASAVQALPAMQRQCKDAERAADLHVLREFVI